MTKTKEKVKNMPSFKYDLSAATLLGILAGTFATISAAGSGILNVKLLGITLSPYLIFGLFLFLCVAGIVVGRFLAKYLEVLYKFLKFGEAGGLNWLVDLGVINLLMLVTGITAGLWTSIFKGISFTVAVTNSYFWNKKWVFYGHKKQNETQEFSKFLTASLMGLALNIGVFSLIKYAGPLVFTGLTSAQWVSMATIVGSLGAMVFNFVLYKIWVFKD